MASGTLEREFDVTDKRVNQLASGGTIASPMATPLEYTSQSALDTRLLAIGGWFTQARINGMTKNDKVYAVRLNDDAAGVK